jgi:hypothetical protein
MQHPLPIAGSIRRIVKSTLLEVIRPLPVMRVTHTIIRHPEGLYLLRETTAIMRRPRFAGAM